MGIFAALRHEFLDVIEWVDATDDTLAYCFARPDGEIKNNSKLVVRPGQKVVFVSEGQITDCFYEPGTYELDSRNLPVLSKVLGWKYGFESPFKAEVYFFSTRNFMNLKWGTPNPIALRDADFGVVRLRSFGSYAIQVVNPAAMLEALIGTNPRFEVAAIEGQIRSWIVSGFATWVSRAQVPLLDLAAQYRELSETLRQAVLPELAQFGLEVTALVIENISVPPEVEKAIDQRSAMGAIGNLQQFTQYQTAQAIAHSAQNPSGGNAGLEMGLGLAMAQQLAAALQAQPGAPAALPALPSPPVTPPPLDAGQSSPPEQWYAAVNQQQLGPLSTADLLAAGIRGDTLVWRSGLAQWQAAQTMPELRDRLATPPPLPVAEWYLGVGGQKLGPLAIADLPQNGLTAQSYVWKAGMAQWQLASEVPEIAVLLS